jgi:hypothetical protein
VKRCGTAGGRRGAIGSGTGAAGGNAAIYLCRCKSKARGAEARERASPVCPFARQSGERGRSTTKTAACDMSDATLASRTFYLRGRFFEHSKLFIHACICNGMKVLPARRRT